MTHPDEDLIDPEDLRLTVDELSAKFLELVRSISTSETNEEKTAIKAKARAYLKRSVELSGPAREHASSVFPSLSEVRWRDRHESMRWDEIQNEWMTLRNKIESLAQRGWPAERIELVQDLTRLECFIEDCWPDQSDVVGQIRAERLAAEVRRPPLSRPT
ncbi:MAG TPA: hypothetical protein VN841_13090 [Bryobacteraceae bacterium]|nr:hypothetical protein [Bryobacteraceae bacterium]